MTLAGILKGLKESSNVGGEDVFLFNICVTVFMFMPNPQFVAIIGPESVFLLHIHPI